MATKKITTEKNVLSFKSIKKMIDIVYDKSTPLPVLDNVLFKNDTIVCSDLQTTIIIPFKTKLNNLVPIAQLKTIFDLYESGKFSAKKADKEKYEITFTSDVDTIKMKSESADSYIEYEPSETKHKTIDKVGEINPEIINQLVEASNFVGKDELRFVMMNVFVFDQVVSTNAHQLYFEDVKGDAFTSSCLFNEKSIKLLKHIGGSWIVKKENQRSESGHNIILSARIICESSGGIKIIFRECDERFPNYKAVIPERHQISMTVPSSDLDKIIQKALKFSNSTTHQIVFDIRENKLGVSAIDNDFDNEFNTSIDVSSTGRLRIGFNGIFVRDFIKFIDGDMIFSLSEPNRAAIINDKFLLMPVMLNV